MKYLKAIFFSIILLPLYSFAQINYDSIYQAVKSFDDKSKQISFLDSLLDKASAERMITYDSLYLFLMELNRNSDDINSEIRNAAGLAYHYYLNYEDQKAVNLLDQYQDQIPEMSNSIDKAYAYHKFGIILKIVNRDQDALDYFNQAIEQFEMLNDSTVENFGNALVEKGQLLISKGDFGAGSVALNKAKAIFIHNQDSAGMRVLYRELFIMFSQIELYEEAERYADLTFSYLNDQSDQEDYFILTINSARNLLYQEKYDQAIHQLLSVQHIDFDYGKLYLYNGVIEGLYFAGRPDSIGYWFNILESIYDRMNSPEEFKFLILQSRFLKQLSERRYARAEKDGKALMTHALAINDVAEIMMYNRFLAELYKQQGNFRQAFEFSNAYIKARDSIQAANKSNALLLYQTQYETKEKENEIAQLSLNTQLLESKISRNRLSRILLLTVLGLLLVTSIFIYNRMQYRQIARMQELRTNISSDLHDEVGSLLSGISMQADIIRAIPDEQSKMNMLGEIGQNTRKALTTMRDLVWSIDSRRDKIKDLKDKIAETCAALLPPERFRYQIHSAADLDRILNPSVKKEVYLICKEAIHNISKHSNGDEVVINIQHRSTELMVTIKDNGTRVEEKISSGQGIDNMHRRATSVGGEIKIERGAFGYEVSCIVPLG